MLLVPEEHVPARDAPGQALIRWNGRRLELRCARFGCAVLIGRQASSIFPVPEKLVGYYEFIEDKMGLQGKTALARLTSRPSIIVASIPDDPPSRSVGHGG